MNPTYRRLILVVAGIATFAIGLFFVYVLTSALNDDLYSRFTQTIRVNNSFGNKAPIDEDPLLRFVVNRLVPEENAAEISLLLIVDTHTPTGIELRDKKGTLVAQAEDGSSSEANAASVQAEVLSATKFNPGQLNAITRSPRSYFPTFTSIEAFPFDKVSIRPMFRLTDTDGRWMQHRIEVQKAFPGRHMSVRWDNGGVRIDFSRSKLEIVYVLVVSVIFLIATVAVFVGSILHKSSATSLENILSVAGLLVAAAGYRDILGVSKLPSTSILELIVLGIPTLLLVISLTFSMYRAHSQNNA